MKETTTKTATATEISDEQLQKELDELIANDFSGCGESYKAKAAKRQLAIAEEYGGTQKVTVGEVTRKHLDLANKRLLLELSENIVSKTKSGTQKHKGAFIQATSVGEVAALRKAVSTYTDWAVVDKASMEVIAIISEDNE